MTWDDLAGLLPALIFIALLLRGPIKRLAEAAKKHRERERDGFRRDYEPIEPD